MKKIYLSVFLTLVLLSGSVYYLLDDDVKISIEKTRTKYFIQDDGWVLSATEYVNLYDGTKKMRAKSRKLINWNNSDFAYTQRVSTWKDNIVTIQTYTFSLIDDEITQFPLKNEFECLNCEGKIVHYEIRDILYTGETKKIVSPFSFGHNMKIEFDDGHYYSKVFQQKSSDKIIIKYRPNSIYETYNVRLFDPPAPTGVNSTKIETGNFGGKQIVQVETDENYPCYLQSSGKVICPAIKSNKLNNLKSNVINSLTVGDVYHCEGKFCVIPSTNEITELKVKKANEILSKGIPKTDLRKSKFIFNKTENWTDEQGINWTINILTFDGYEETYLDYSVDNEFDLDYSIDGKVRVGFNSNVWEITDFVFGSADDVTAKSYGVVLENTHADYDADMVGWYKFDNDATDSSGEGNDGNVSGSTHNFSWYEFDGSDDYIDCGNDVSLQFGGKNEISISAWVYIEGLTGTEQEIIRQDLGYYVRITNSRQIYWKTYTSNAIMTDDTITLKTWTHILSTYDGVNMKVYINGVLSKSVSSTGNIGSSTDIIQIASGLGGTGEFFNGSIDEVIIYNRSLNSTEILALYNKNLFKHQGNYTSGILDAGQNVNWTNINWTFSNSTANQNVSMQVRTGEIAKPDFADSSLVSMWSLNQTDTNGTKTLAIDTMGRNNGTANGGLSLGSVGGVFQGENATEFDGVDDYVNILKEGISGITTKVSLGFWIKLNELGVEESPLSWDGKSGYDGYIKKDISNNWKFKVENQTQGNKEFALALLINDKEWHHVVLTVDVDNNNISSYKDGIIYKTDTLGFTGDLDFATNDDFIIGDGVYSNFNGSIAYVSIFNKSLTSEEIMNWSTYTGELLISQGETLDLPVNRFLQYKAKLQTNTSETPILINVVASYGPYAESAEILFKPLAVYANSLWMLTFSLDGASNTPYEDTCGTISTVPTDSINTKVNGSYALSWSGQNSHLGNSEKSRFSLFNFPRFFYDTYRVFIRMNTTSNAVTSFNLNLTEVIDRTGIGVDINDSTYRLYRINENGGVYNDTGICYEQPVIVG